MSLASIYLITHVADGRVYVGQTRRKRRGRAMARWNDHVSAAMSGRTRTHFHCAIRKYGSAAFSFMVIETCESGLANERERHYIALYKANQKAHGFNMSEGGDGGQNSVTEESRRRISDTKRGVSTGPCSIEKAEKISQTKLAQGLKHSPETRRRISENRKVTALTEEWRNNIAKGLRKSAKFTLTPEQVVEITTALATSSDSVIMAKFNVSRKMIWRIRKGLYRQVIPESFA
ncbi:GIY-YIG nuclease family protein [Polaromonas sp. P1(28)-13]|nr:GIY-YIG nuclease family protein [Polaromonas sp. P1(28)-13]